MKIEKCLFCGKSETMSAILTCVSTELCVCVVCNVHEGGCGASSGYYDSAEKAIAAWNCRAGKDFNVVTNADRIRA